MMDLRILLVDDYAPVRRGLRALLETHPDWKVSDEATNGREAVEKALQTHPDVIVLDIEMPQMNGLEATRRIHAASPDAAILIFSQHDSEQVVQDALHAGAQGYLFKSDAAQDLLSAVEAVSQHKAYVSSTVARTLTFKVH
jgi:DNA-binding NarL/FixJ family response regulator